MAKPVKTRSKSSTPSRTSPFKMEHLLMFGLKITQTGVDSRVSGHQQSVVTAVRCLFCLRLGRDAVEHDDGRKRKRTQNTKYFTAPFHRDNFTLHVKSQHPAKIDKCSSLGLEERKIFVDVKKRTQDSIYRYLNAAQTALNIRVSKAIVETIIGEIFFKPELDEDD